jgi:hypothetical protein
MESLIAIGAVLGFLMVIFGIPVYQAFIAPKISKVTTRAETHQVEGVVFECEFTNGTAKQFKIYGKLHKYGDNLYPATGIDRSKKQFTNDFILNIDDGKLYGTAHIKSVKNVGTLLTYYKVTYKIEKAPFYEEEHIADISQLGTIVKKEG